MTKDAVYLSVILGMLGGMYYEYWVFCQHYDGLVQQLELIKKVCKVRLES